MRFLTPLAGSLKTPNMGNPGCTPLTKTTITKADVEETSLAWIGDLGWMVAHGPDIAPNTLATLRARPS